MSDDEALRQQLAKAIDWHEAHADFHAAIGDFPAKLRGRVPEGFPYSAWQLLEHIRLALWDILEFSRDAWDRSIKAVEEHVDAMRKLVTDPSRDLFAPLPHGTGQTLLREVLLVVDHNAYHLGQLVLVRRALGAWHD